MYLCTQFAAHPLLNFQVLVFEYLYVVLTLIEQKFCLFTEAYAEYKIWIKAYTVKNEGKSSEPLVVMTDVRAPGQPIVVNLTCQNGNTLFLKWLRPTLYYRTVDVYNVHYRPEENKKWEIQVVETVNNTINHMVIIKLFLKRFFHSLWIKDS